jgi:hypothetical protein
MAAAQGGKAGPRRFRHLRTDVDDLADALVTEHRRRAGHRPSAGVDAQVEAAQPT